MDAKAELWKLKLKNRCENKEMKAEAEKWKFM
jgi:hypothetical protein